MEIIYFIIKVFISLLLLFMIVPVLSYFISYQWKTGELNAWINFAKNPKNKKQKEEHNGEEE